ncbi:hypothetical protein AN958_01357 [Leucoagaricus sp. SymC.cos]|nr:hypothetical protein AN958_01357 [Leucoagaricus sp. SymC.cos]
MEKVESVLGKVCRPFTTRIASWLISGPQNRTSLTSSRVMSSSLCCPMYGRISHCHTEPVLGVGSELLALFGSKCYLKNPYFTQQHAIHRMLSGGVHLATTTAGPIQKHVKTAPSNTITPSSPDPSIRFDSPFPFYVPDTFSNESSFLYYQSIIPTLQKTHAYKTILVEVPL